MVTTANQAVRRISEAVCRRASSVEQRTPIRTGTTKETLSWWAQNGQ